MFSGWFRSTPEPLPPINFAKRNKILEGAAANIKLLYKFLHEHANIVKGDEHLRECRLEAMLDLLDELRSSFEATRIPDPEHKSVSSKAEFRRCNTDLRRSTTPITIHSSSSTGSLRTTPASVTVTDKLSNPNPFSASSSKTPPTSLSDKRPSPLSGTPPKPSFNPNGGKEYSRRPSHLMTTPPLSPKPHKHMSTPPISPKPRRPPPLSVPSSPLQDSDSNNGANFVETIDNLKTKLASATAARRSLENSCATIGRDNGALAVELARKNRELAEADEAVKELMDLNQRLYCKLTGEEVDCDVPEELVKMNKKLTDRVHKAAEDYKTIMKGVKEGISLDSRIASEMGSVIEILSRVRHDRTMDERHDIVKMRKLLAKMECYLAGWIERLDHSPIRRIE